MMTSFCLAVVVLAELTNLDTEQMGRFRERKKHWHKGFLVSQLSYFGDRMKSRMLAF